MKRFALVVVGILVCASAGFAESTPIKVQISFMGPQAVDNMVASVVGAGGVGGNAIYSKDAGVNQTLFQYAQDNSTICVNVSTNEGNEGDFEVTEILPLDECK